MPAAEARQRKPKYREYKRVRDAEQFARNVLGVQEVDYGGNLAIANVSNHALFTAKERGVPMPSRAIVKAQFRQKDGEDPNDYAYYLANPGSKAPGEIYINAGRKVWTNIDAAMQEGRQRNIFSTGDPRHLVLHEMGELARHQSVGADRFDPLHGAYLRDEQAFQQLNQERIKALVSNYAGTNHAEFVSELFTGLVLGREDLRQHHDLLQAFHRFGGDKMVQWSS
jgi:hypothetical protein